MNPKLTRRNVTQARSDVRRLWSQVIFLMLLLCGLHSDTASARDLDRQDDQHYVSRSVKKSGRAVGSRTKAAAKSTAEGAKITGKSTARGAKVAGRGTAKGAKAAGRGLKKVF